MKTSSSSSSPSFYFCSSTNSFALLKKRSLNVHVSFAYSNSSPSLVGWLVNHVSRNLGLFILYKVFNFSSQYFVFCLISFFKMSFHK